MEINKLFVQIFQTLVDNSSNSDDTTEFNKLSVVFGTLHMNEELLLKFSNNWTNHNTDISSMVYFKNTNFKGVYDNLSEDKQQFIYNCLKNIYDTAQEKLLSKHIPSKPKSFDECKELLFNNEQLKKMFKLNKMSKKKLHKLLNNNSEFQKLFDQYKNKIGSSGSGGDDTSINNLFKNLLKDNKVFPQMMNLMNQPAVQNLIKNLQTEIKNWTSGGKFGSNSDSTGTGTGTGTFTDKGDTEFKLPEEMNEMKSKIPLILKKIHKRIQREHPEILIDSQKIASMFDIDKLQITIKNIMNKIQTTDFSDTSNFASIIKECIDDDPTIQNVLWKLHMTLESGLINLQKIKQNSRIVMNVALEEFTSSDLINMSECSILTKLFFKSRMKKKKKTPDERRQNRLNKHRRKKRAEYKKKKKVKKKKKRH